MSRSTVSSSKTLIMNRHAPRPYVEPAYASEAFRTIFWHVVGCARQRGGAMELYRQC